MSLTDGESHRLREIETALSREDPQLRRELTSWRPRQQRSYRVGKITMLVSFPLLTVGSALQLPAVCAAAWLGLLVGGLLAVGHLLAVLGPPPSGDRTGHVWH
jgi:hypothetical protein